MENPEPSQPDTCVEGRGSPACRSAGTAGSSECRQDAPVKQRSSQEGDGGAGPVGEAAVAGAAAAATAAASQQQQQQPPEQAAGPQQDCGPLAPGEGQPAEGDPTPERTGRGDAEEQQLSARAEQQGEAEQQGGQAQEGEQAQEQLSDDEALARAEAFKKEGNELFGRGLWDEAAAKYNSALDIAPESAAKEQAIYFANLAACNIKTQQYAAAVQNCTEAISLDPSYQKAYMRRCEAYERLDELDHALGDAKRLLEQNPDSAWARAKVAALQPIVDERAEKLKTEMFSKLKDLGNTILGKFGLSCDNFKFDKDPNTGGYNIRFER